MDDVLLNKASNIERCIKRIEEDYFNSKNDFETNFTKQDAVILNLLRACESAIDMGNRVIRLKSLGLPQTSRDVFVLLENAKIIDPGLSRSMQAMVGFRNIAIHNYTTLNIVVVKSIVDNNLKELLNLSKMLLSSFP